MTFCLEEITNIHRQEDVLRYNLYGEPFGKTWRERIQDLNKRVLFVLSNSDYDPER